MPITSAPARLANWTVIEPTPPAAPEIATVSPNFRDTARTDAYAGASGNGERPGNFPRYVRWLEREVLRVDDDILGVAGAPVGETDDLVPDRDRFNADADLGHDSGQVATLAGRKTVL
jgi:hypothetical protein